jgi:heat shock protein HtpX
VIAIILGLVLWVLQENAYPVSVLIIGAGFLIPGLYKFQKTTVPEQTTIFELMKDPYANPLRGRFVKLQGTVIGKADAGNYFSEDVTMQDQSKCLIYLNYQSILPLIGDLYFGLKKAKKLIDEHVTATGWFRRSSYQVIDLYTLVTDEKTIKSYVQFWGIILGIIILVIGLVLLWLNPAIIFSDPTSMIQYERIQEIKDAITAYFR